MESYRLDETKTVNSSTRELTGAVSLRNVQMSVLRTGGQGVVIMGEIFGEIDSQLIMKISETVSWWVWMSSARFFVRN